MLPCLQEKEVPAAFGPLSPSSANSSVLSMNTRPFNVTSFFLTLVLGKVPAYFGKGCKLRRVTRALHSKGRCSPGKATANRPRAQPSRARTGLLPTPATGPAGQVQAGFSTAENSVLMRNRLWQKQAWSTSAGPPCS